MPEFLINLDVLLGIPMGRLFIPMAHLDRFSDWRSSIQVHRVTSYRSGEVVLFFAPIAEYEKLAKAYPHHRYSAYTEYLLSSGSTYFRSLKPPYLDNCEYIY